MEQDLRSRKNLKNASPSLPQLTNFSHQITNYQGKQIPHYQQHRSQQDDHPAPREQQYHVLIFARIAGSEGHVPQAAPPQTPNVIETSRNPFVHQPVSFSHHEPSHRRGSQRSLPFSQHFSLVLGNFDEVLIL
jgi:hypothetical protein